MTAIETAPAAKSPEPVPAPADAKGQNMRIVGPQTVGALGLVLILASLAMLIMSLLTYRDLALHDARVRMSDISRGVAATVARLAAEGAGTAQGLAATPRLTEALGAYLDPERRTAVYVIGPGNRVIAAAATPRFGTPVQAGLPVSWQAMQQMSDDPLTTDDGNGGGIVRPWSFAQAAVPGLQIRILALESVGRPELLGHHLLWLVINVLPGALLLGLFGVFVLMDWRRRDGLTCRLEAGLIRYRRAFRLAQAGTLELHVATRRLRCSASWLALIGERGPVRIAGMKAWMDRVHPHDRIQVERMLQAALSGHLLRFEQDYRLRHRDGSFVEIQERGQMLVTRGGGKRLLLVHEKRRLVPQIEKPQPERESPPPRPAAQPVPLRKPAGAA